MNSSDGGSSSRSALPNGAHCFDDIAATHYQLANAVPMTYPQRTTNLRTLLRCPSRSALPIGSFIYIFVRPHLYLISPDQNLKKFGFKIVRRQRYLSLGTSIYTPL